MKLFTTIMLTLGVTLAVALSATALTVSLTHAGPQGQRGTTGQQGPAGPAGPEGPAGQDAPTLGYQCQMLFPKNGGTETTMYWPCTDSSGNG